MPDSNEDIRLKNIEAVMLRMDGRLDSIDTRLRELEKREDASQTELKMRIEASMKATEELAKDVASLRSDFVDWKSERKTALEKEADDRKKADEGINQKVTTLELWQSAVDVKTAIVTWVAIGFGASMIGLIWAILTHTVTLSFVK